MTETSFFLINSVTLLSLVVGRETRDQMERYGVEWWRRALVNLFCNFRGRTEGVGGTWLCPHHRAHFIMLEN